MIELAIAGLATFVSFTAGYVVSDYRRWKKDYEAWQEWQNVQFDEAGDCVYCNEYVDATSGTYINGSLVCDDCDNG